MAWHRQAHKWTVVQFIGRKDQGYLNIKTLAEIIPKPINRWNWPLVEGFNKIFHLSVLFIYTADS